MLHAILFHITKMTGRTIEIKSTGKLSTWAGSNELLFISHFQIKNK